MKRSLLILLILSLFFIYPSGTYAQENNGSISGQISLPTVKKQKRSFRGRLYRNRLTDSAKDSVKSTNNNSPFIDVIIILNPLSFKAKTTPMTGVKIIQKSAKFIPRVVPITRNSTVEFINYDKFYHNVFSVTPGAKFNIGRRPTNTVVSRIIERPGEIEIFCDIHSQMNATIISLDTPYFTRVNPIGKYELSNLPEGEYMLEVFHPDLPKIEEFITVSKGQHLIKNFTLSR